MNNYEIFNGDCFDIMQDLINKEIKVDCIIADIPYNIKYDEWDKNFDSIKALDYSLDLLKDTGNLILFQGWSEVCKLVDHIQNRNDCTLQNWIIWDRIKGRGGKRNFTSTREDILWITKSDKYTFNKMYSNIPKKTKGMGEKNGQANRSLTNVWYDISPIVPWSKERNGHPTQKPLQLMDRLVDIYTNEGDTILDFTMGSGSTGVSCLRKNRKFIGIELDKQWFDIAENRLADANKDLSEIQ